MADIPALIDSLHPLEIKVLGALAAVRSQPLEGVLRDEEIVRDTGLESAQVSMALGWLLSKGLVRQQHENVTRIVRLTEVGEKYFEKYSPEERILSAIRDAAKTGKRLTIQDIQSQEEIEAAEMSSAIGRLKKEGSIRIGAGASIESTGNPSRLGETIRTVLRQLRSGPQPLTAFPEAMWPSIEDHAVKRGNPKEPFRIDGRVERSYELTAEGKSIAEQVSHGLEEDLSQLTPELLKDGSWRAKRFRKYSISLRPPRLAAGKRHSYREFLDGVKRRLVSMGFREMRGPLVETEFWNMDTLYMPQFHPARAIHDVYFVKEPSHAKALAEPFVSRVAAVHRDGGDTGSSGWGYDYDRERARRLVLRSQGTAVSSRMLAAGPEIPGKYFSIARCFRYDQVDATHATDFFQVEGIVLGEDITFRTLLGLLDLFAREVAHANEIKFLPAYFPFTEPSVELHVRHPRLGWMELGGAGLFRPEVTMPLGVNVPVIAWGLGLDRMAMVALGIHDIRDLFSPDLEVARTMRGKF